ncbi:MAG: AAA family ATPase [Melioribacteraceae bacterium]|nr:AAA family ATPase [Melioribacteraceae bacterium]
MDTFKRELTKNLVQWKKNNLRKPLILRGARQVGKTTLIREFAESYKQRIILNLEKPSDLYYFENYDNVKDIIDALFLKHSVSLDKISETLLFIDEIQESPQAIQFLRYFYEEVPQLHVIAAGSLLEFALKNVKSFPVGRVEYLYLHPLNFIEYLKAIKHTGAIKELNRIPIKPFAHNTLLELFNRYAIVGGMPEVVKIYLQNRSVAELYRTYESLWETYKDDVEKYTTNKTERNVIKHIMATSFLYLDQRVKFQNFGNSNYRSREVGEAMRNLEGAKLIRLIYPTTDIEVPIKPDLKKSPRLQFLDTGIINFITGIQADMLPLKDLSSLYKGRLIPHLIVQEIISLNTTSDRKPNFWVRERSQSSAEVDLVIPYKDKVIPIEIKSGSVGTLKSLHQFMNKANHPYAIRIYAGEFNVQTTQTREGRPFLLMNLPYYLGTKIYEYIDDFISNYKL